MAIPTISSIDPTLGHTGGQQLCEILGTNFREPTAPTLGAGTTPASPPSVEVEIGGEVSPRVFVIGPTRLFCITPERDEGTDLDVVVRNIDDNGDPIPTEAATLTSAYSFRCAQLYTISDLARVFVMMRRSMRRQIHPEITHNPHTDFDDTTSDLLNIAKLAKLPAVLLAGPVIEENKFYSLNELPTEVSVSDPEEFFIRREPTTVDLIFQFLGVSNSKQEAMNLSNAVLAYFRKNKWLVVDRDPADSTKGIFGGDNGLEMDLEPGGFPVFVARSGNDNLKTFRGSYRIRGLDVGEHHGFEQDLVVRAARKSLDDPEDFLDLQGTTQTGQTFPVGTIRGPRPQVPGIPFPKFGG